MGDHAPFSQHTVVLFIDCGKMRCHNVLKHQCGDNCGMPALLDHGETLSMKVIELIQMESGLSVIV